MFQVKSHFVPAQAKTIKRDNCNNLTRITSENFHLVANEAKQIAYYKCNEQVVMGTRYYRLCAYCCHGLKTTCLLYTSRCV